MAKLIKVQSMLRQTHSYTVLRVKEILAWSESEPYKAILAGNYLKRGEQPSLLSKSNSPAEPTAARKRHRLRRHWVRRCHRA